VEWGGHREETFLNRSLLASRVDLAIEPIRKAMKKESLSSVEIELAFRFIHAPIVAVMARTEGRHHAPHQEMLKEDGRKVAWRQLGEPLILLPAKREGKV
jgi:hypothetical protein